MAACLAGVLADGRRAQGVGGALCLPPPEVVSQSHRDALEVLLRAKACRLRKTQPRGRGYRDCVEVLVRAKADLDKAQPHGMAAVRIVAQGGGPPWPIVKVVAFCAKADVDKAADGSHSRVCHSPKAPPRRRRGDGAHQGGRGQGRAVCHQATTMMSSRCWCAPKRTSAMRS